MTTLAEHIIVAGAENRPPMLEKSMYDSWMINDMHTIGMTMQQVQVNTKFLNALPSEWSKFVTDVKLAKSLYTTNYDQLYAYLSQHERHANEVRINRERYLDSLDFVANSPTLYNPSQSPQHSSYSMYPPPQQFTPVYAAPIHHQHHHTPVNPVNPQQHPVFPSPFISPSMTPQSQAEFPQLDSGLAVPMVVKSSFNKFRVMLVKEIEELLLTLKGNVTVGPSRVVKCYNCQGEGHMARQSFQTDDLDAYDSDCDDLSLAKAVLMANLSSCDHKVLSEQEIDTLKETLSNNVKEKESLSKTLTVFKTESKEKESKYIDKEIVLEKQNKELENIICKMYRSTQAMHMLTKPQVFYDDTHKQAFGYQNLFHLKKAQWIQPTLYDGSVIAKEHAVISVIDDEDTLILE
ncbi:integrase, catalytic region, zinc finger, CCHC-type containing protein [Tanacetum coccineum]